MVYVDTDCDGCQEEDNEKENHSCFGWCFLLAWECFCFCFLVLLFQDESSPRREIISPFFFIIGDLDDTDNGIDGNRAVTMGELTVPARYKVPFNAGGALAEINLQCDQICKLHETCHQFMNRYIYPWISCICAFSHLSHLSNTDEPNEPLHRGLTCAESHPSDFQGKHLWTYASWCHFRNLSSTKGGKQWLVSPWWVFCAQQ